MVFRLAVCGQTGSLYFSKARVCVARAVESAQPESVQVIPEGAARIAWLVSWRFHGNRFPKISVSFFLTPTQKRGCLFNPRFCNDSDAYTWTVRPCSLFKLPQVAFELVTLVPGLTHDDCRNLEKKLEEVPPSLAAKHFGVYPTGFLNLHR